jgi:hypothetical protein
MPIATRYCTVGISSVLYHAVRTALCLLHTYCSRFTSHSRYYVCLFVDAYKILAPVLLFSQTDALLYLRVLTADYVLNPCAAQRVIGMPSVLAASHGSVLPPGTPLDGIANKEIEMDKSMPIAIVGMGCRFPQDATSPEKLWDMLYNKQSAKTDIPTDRFNAEAFYHPDGDRNGAVRETPSFTPGCED